MPNIDQLTREEIGDPPDDDPVARGRHVLRAYHLNNDSQILVDATRQCYTGVPWTGMTWGDLRQLVRLAQLGREAEELSAELVRLHMPAIYGGYKLTLTERVKSLLSAPFKPRRDDAVARWLKRMRDGWKDHPAYNNQNTFQGAELRASYRATDALLDRYRECADHGLTLEPEDDDKGDR